MKNVEFYPLGSVVRLKNSVRDVMIVSRGMTLPIEDEKKFFDYGACSYPEGVVDENLFYFNHEDVETVKFEGYRDAQDKEMRDSINKFIAENDVERGNTTEIYEKLKEENEAVS